MCQYKAPLPETEEGSNGEGKMVFKVAWQRVHVMGWKNAKSAALSLCSIELHWSLSPPKRRISQRAAQFAQNRAAPAIRANFDNGSVDAGQSCSLSFFAFFSRYHSTYQ